MKAEEISDSILTRVNNDRQFFETLGVIYPVSKHVSVTESNITDVKSYWFKPNSGNAENIIVYLHGGGFTSGSLNSHKAMVSHVCEATNSKILFIEYSLAPENPFPAAIDQIVAIYKELLKVYQDNNISIMGDSAGGGLAVSIIYSIIKNNLKLPSSVILFSPWINLKCNTNSYKTRQTLDPMLTKQYLLQNTKYYAGNNKDANPNELDFEKFPPTFIVVGSNEILFDDAKNFYDYIKTIQPDTVFKEYEDQTHVWLLTNIDGEKSKEVLSDIVKFVNNRL